MKHNVARSLPWLFLAAVIVAGSIIAARAAAKGTATEAARQAQVATRTLIARQCDRNQVNRAWQRVRARVAPAISQDTTDRYVRAADRYFPIVNCAATYDVSNTTGRTVYLPPREDACFLKLTMELYWTDAVGSERPPVTNPDRLRHICATK